MRYLGIDYGDKRIGIAISDEEGQFAFPKMVARNEWSEVREKTKNFIEKNNIATIVVGLPQNFKGEDTEQTRKVRAFTERLRKELGVEIVFENEILTSKYVEKNRGATKEMVDASSAALILQSFLDRLDKVQQKICP